MRAESSNRPWAGWQTERETTFSFLLAQHADFTVEITLQSSTKNLGAWRMLHIIQYRITIKYDHSASMFLVRLQSSANVEPSSSREVSCPEGESRP